MRVKSAKAQKATSMSAATSRSDRDEPTTDSSPTAVRDLGPGGEPPVRVCSLVKRGGRFRALDGLDLPVEAGSELLAPSEAERTVLEQRQTVLREGMPGMVFLSFPGDEKHMGGCLAAGRGFFHINAYGAAEACPFSPYSDRSLREHTLLEVLDSPFFARLQQESLVGGEHDGGCALFQKRAKVQALLK